MPLQHALSERQRHLCLFSVGSSSSPREIFLSSDRVLAELESAPPASLVAHGARLRALVAKVAKAAKDPEATNGACLNTRRYR